MVGKRQSFGGGIDSQRLSDTAATMQGHAMGDIGQNGLQLGMALTQGVRQAAGTAADIQKGSLRWTARAHKLQQGGYHLLLDMRMVVITVGAETEISSQTAAIDSSGHGRQNSRHSWKLV